jgi:hypothetical protein
MLVARWNTPERKKHSSSAIRIDDIKYHTYSMMSLKQNATITFLTYKYEGN